MQLNAIVEALIVASDEPLKSEEIARLVRSEVAEQIDAAANYNTENPDSEPQEVEPEIQALEKTSDADVMRAIEQLNSMYSTAGRSFTILERAKGWKIFTKPDYADFVRQLFPGQKPKRLSPTAMETLAIIAYRQPVTKAAIEAVRGVSCDGMIQKLLDHELIHIIGRAELPGRPLLYETTELFFEHFGIKEINDLPNAAELRAVKLPEPDSESEEKAENAEEQLALKAMDSDSSKPK